MARCRTTDGTLPHHKWPSRLGTYDEWAVPQGAGSNGEQALTHAARRAIGGHEHLGHAVARVRRELSEDLLARIRRDRAVEGQHVVRRAPPVGAPQPVLDAAARLDCVAATHSPRTGRGGVRVQGGSRWRV
eukprot:343750-Prymnesium_polylepis.1